MKKRTNTPMTHGQGIVEYALILVLVAVLVAGAALLIGLGIQRIYALVAGGLATKHNTIGVLEILDTPLPPTCWLKTTTDSYGPPMTGLQLFGFSAEPLENLTYSSNLTYGTGAGGGIIQLEPNGPNGFTIHHQLADHPDRSLCPTAVVIQSKSGAIAESPVTIKDW